MLALMALGPLVPAISLRVLHPAPAATALAGANADFSHLYATALLLYAAVAMAGCGRLLIGAWLARRTVGDGHARAGWRLRIGGGVGAPDDRLDPADDSAATRMARLGRDEAAGRTHARDRARQAA